VLLQATESEGLAQGPYVATRVRFKPATLRTDGSKLTTEPPRIAIAVCAYLYLCPFICSCVHFYYTSLNWLSVMLFVNL